MEVKLPTFTGVMGWAGLVVIAVLFLVGGTFVVFILGSIVPFVPPIRHGMPLWILDSGSIYKTGEVLKDELQKALEERDRARADAREAQSYPRREDIDQANRRFALADRAVARAHWRMDRFVGVMFLTGRGRDVLKFLK